MGQQDSHCQPLLDSYRQTLRTLLRKRAQLLVEWAGIAAGSVRPLRGTGIAAKQPPPNKEPYDLRRGTGPQSPERVDPERDGGGRHEYRLACGPAVEQPLAQRTTPAGLADDDAGSRHPSSRP